MVASSPKDALAALWECAGLGDRPIPPVRFAGADPVLPSSFAIGTAAAATICAVGAAAASLHHQRGGPSQSLAVDLHHAATEFRSERHQLVDGGPAPELWDDLAGAYPTGDKRWVRLHTNFAHHRQGVLDILGCAPTRDAVAAALMTWKAEQFEAEADRRGLVVAMQRTAAEWAAHPQAQALQTLPVITLERIGNAPPQPLAPAGAQPLSGLRVLELTRIIAGPVGGRALAGHGADVLYITSPNLPAMAPLVIDGGRGKRSAFVDLEAVGDVERLRALAAEADVFIQGYRPGGLTQRGFGPEALAERKPGIICVSLSAYGHVGPWAGKRGFDSLVQTATGINADEAAAEAGKAPDPSVKPRPLPCQALDHASGYLIAFGAIAARLRQAHEGGSWHVRVSLAQTGQWLRTLGRVEDGIGFAEPTAEMLEPLFESQSSGFGTLTSVRHAAGMSETPVRWALPSAPLGTHAAEW